MTSSSGLKTLSLTRSRLQGEVRVSGAKNSVLRLLAASLLTSDPITLDNCPIGLLDVEVHLEMLKKLGKTCITDGDTLQIVQQQAPSSVLEWSGRSIRNTLLILGALVSRTGAGKVPLPGGCKLGERKYDLHEMVLRELGANVWVEGDDLCAEAPDGLVGSDIYLPLRSTGATENAMLCGALARGTTTLWNPHVRPEILDLARFLNRMGAQITVNGQESIVIKGVDRLGGINHRVMADNMEAMTWLIGAVVTGGDVEISDFPYSDLEVPIIFLRDSGARIFINEDRAIIRGGRPLPIEISTGPYPGINSDMQPLFAAYGACARGQSRITDLRFVDRYGYLEEFSKLGVKSEVKDGAAKLKGGNKLNGSDVRALDLRAGAALSILGLVAEGETLISDAWQIERGYDRFVEKLRLLGGNVHALY